MKHKPEEYINCGFYGADDTKIEHYNEKLVKCRKPHECMGGCKTTIKLGEMALCETGFMDGKPVSCYTCIPCLDEWLDMINGEQDEEDNPNSGDYGLDGVLTFRGAEVEILEELNGGTHDPA